MTGINCEEGNSGGCIDCDEGKYGGWLVGGGGRLERSRLVLNPVDLARFCLPLLSILRLVCVSPDLNAEAQGGHRSDKFVLSNFLWQPSDLQVFCIITQGYITIKLLAKS